MGGTTGTTTQGGRPLKASKSTNSVHVQLISRSANCSTNCKTTKTAISAKATCGSQGKKANWGSKDSKGRIAAGVQCSGARLQTAGAADYHGVRKGYSTEVSKLGNVLSKADGQQRQLAKVAK